MCNIQTINDFGGNSCAYKMEHILGVTFIYGSNNITQKTYFPMRFVLLVSQCSLPSIESFLVSIKISPRLLEELPDCFELTCIKALWYKVSRGQKSSIS